MIEGILLDIDNTLYDYDVAHNAGINSVFEQAESQKYYNFSEAYKEARHEINQELKNTASSHNRLLYFQRTLEKIGVKNLSATKLLYDIYWNTFLENIIPFDGVYEFLEKNKDKKICLLTDLTTYIQYRKIERLKLSKYVKYILTSEEAGVEKPSQKMFDSGIRKLGLSKNDVCMIGDSYEKDILGALNAGIKPYWKTKETINDTRITTFDSFYELIGKI